MNRSDRRRIIKERGLNWRDEKARAREVSRLEEACLKVSPAAARRFLAEWASQPGPTEAEIAQLNGIVDIPRKLDF